MAAPQPTRAELIERIRASSKDAVVLAEMQRLGFWLTGEAQPQPATELIEREAALIQELGELQSELRLKGDPEAALRAMRKERLAAARAQRDTKARERADRQYQRALDWHAQRQQQIGYLGAGVSAGLERVDRTSGRTSDAKAQDHDPLRTARPERLSLLGLPALDSPQALAKAMGIELGELRFLSFHREVSRGSHYRRFTLPKKRGGERQISAPMPRLKRTQYWVLDNILAKVPSHDAAHGFLPGRSIVGNAQPHCGQDVVINLDVKDFFPSVGFGRIKGVFAHLGYGEAVATVLALLCSENRADELEVDGERYFVGGKASQRVLPQGAPTSPMLTNLLCRRLDRRLAGLARTMGFAYTRYADDLSFSASGEAAQRVGALLRRVRWILREEDFEPHPEKERVMRKGVRQEVTGVVVNANPGVSRQSRRALRAALHRARHAGVAQAHWQGEPASRDRLLGYAHFVHNVNPAQGRALVDEARALFGGAGASAAPAVAVAAPSDFRRRAANGEAPARAGGPWWQPAPPPAPVRLRTDGELREERAARRQAAAQARRDTAAAQTPPRTARSARMNTSAAAPAPADVGAEVGSGAGGESTPARPPRSSRVYWMQIGVLVLLTLFTNNSRVATFGLAYLIVAYWLRRQRWTPFLIAMAVAILLASIFPRG